MNHTYIVADARKLPLPDESVHFCVTSPPYYSLRKYTESPLEIGRSEHGGLQGYIHGLVQTFAEVRRVLRPDGSLFLNLGDTYIDKQLLGVPWQVAFALRNAGWILRSDTIWHKPNGMPDSARDRPESMHEYLFMFSKTPKTYWDKYAVPRQERLSVRSVPVGRSKTKHFASYPPNLVLPLIRQGTSEAGCCPKCQAPYRRLVRKTRTPTRPGRNNTIDDTGMARRDTRRHVTSVETLGWDATCYCDDEPVCDGREMDPLPCTVLDPFAGVCTTALACEWAGRDSIMVDIGQDYLRQGRERVSTEKPPRPKKEPKAKPDPLAPLPGQMEFPVFSAATGQPQTASY